MRKKKTGLFCSSCKNKFLLVCLSDMFVRIYVNVFELPRTRFSHRHLRYALMHESQVIFKMSFDRYDMACHRKQIYNFPDYTVY